MKPYALALILVAACSNNDPADPPTKEPEEPRVSLPQVHYYSLGRN